MVNQKTYLKGIKTKCPNCDYTNIGLETYMIYNLPNQKFVGDLILTEIERKIGLINCFVICDNCNKKYYTKVGINKSILTSMVIVEK